MEHAFHLEIPVKETRNAHTYEFNSLKVMIFKLILTYRIFLYL